VQPVKCGLSLAEIDGIATYINDDNYEIYDALDENIVIERNANVTFYSHITINKVNKILESSSSTTTFSEDKPSVEIEFEPSLFDETDKKEIHHFLDELGVTVVNYVTDDNGMMTKVIVYVDLYDQAVLVASAVKDCVYGN